MILDSICLYSISLSSYICKTCCFALCMSQNLGPKYTAFLAASIFVCLHNRVIVLIKCADSHLSSKRSTLILAMLQNFLWLICLPCAGPAPAQCCLLSVKWHPSEKEQVGSSEPPFGSGLMLLFPATERLCCFDSYLFKGLWWVVDFWGSTMFLT